MAELKLEMQNRQMADREIQLALNKYQVIIQEQVEKQRSEIKGGKKQQQATSTAVSAAASRSPPTKKR